MAQWENPAEQAGVVLTGLGTSVGICHHFPPVDPSGLRLEEATFPAFAGGNGILLLIGFLVMFVFSDSLLPLPSLPSSHVTLLCFRKK